MSFLIGEDIILTMSDSISVKRRVLLEGKIIIGKRWGDIDIDVMLRVMYISMLIPNIDIDDKITSILMLIDISIDVDIVVNVDIDVDNYTGIDVGVDNLPICVGVDN